MAFNIIDKEWYKTFAGLKSLACDPVKMIAPFLQRETVKELLGDNPKEVKVITRFNLDDFLRKASDIDALEYLLSVGARVKGIKHLHSKVYIFDSTKAIITSANLTHSALYRNTECGVESDDIDFVRTANAYFDTLWAQAGSALDRRALSEWKHQINKSVTAGQRSKSSLGDYGTDLGFDKDGKEQIQYFVKFSGEGNNRAIWTKKVFDEVDESDCHRYATYPKDRRPRIVKDGDRIYFGRMVENPTDIVIFGRAFGLRYNDQKDDAKAQDIKVRPWKSGWPHYIRVYRTEFIDGTLKDGISLYELMKELESDIFATSQSRALNGEPYDDLRDAYRNRPAVRLTEEAATIIDSRLDRIYAKLGRISQTNLARIK